MCFKKYYSSILEMISTIPNTSKSWLENYISYCVPCMLYSKYRSNIRLLDPVFPVLFFLELLVADSEVIYPGNTCTVDRPSCLGRQVNKLFAHGHEPFNLSPDNIWSGDTNF